MKLRLRARLMERQDKPGKFGGWTLKTRRERRERAEELKWAEKSGPVVTTQQERTCCDTPWNTSHTGTCHNSLMRSGEERFFVNE